MTEEAKLIPDLAAITALIDTKINLANAPVNMVLSALQAVVESLQASQVLFTRIGEGILPVLRELQDDQLRLGESLAELKIDQAKLRGVFLSKIDGLKSTIDLLNERTRSSWATADYAIVNSQNAREESARIVAMISALQNQQHLLESQVDELRKNAAEDKDGM